MTDETPNPLEDDATYREIHTAITRPIHSGVTRRGLLAGGLGAAASAVLGYVVGRREGENKPVTGLELPKVTAEWIESEIVNNELTARIHVDTLPSGWEPLVYLT